jgi:hypothetical protein
METNAIKKSPTHYIEMDFCEQTLDKFIQTLQDLEVVKNDCSSYLKYFISSELFVELHVNFL